MQIPWDAPFMGTLLFFLHMGPTFDQFNPFMSATLQTGTNPSLTLTRTLAAIEFYHSRSA